MKAGLTGNRGQLWQTSTAASTSGGAPAQAGGVASEHGGTWAAWITFALLALLVLGWAALVFVIEPIRFAVLAPSAQAGVEAASALAWLFGALVLFLVPDDRYRVRLRWVGAGLVVLGLGRFVYGFLLPLAGDSLDLNASMYASLVTWSVAGGLFVIGLAPATPPWFNRSAFALSLTLFVVLGGLTLAAGHYLPRLVEVEDLEAAAAQGETPLRGLTGWHWALSAVPLGLALVAVAGAVRHLSTGRLGIWLVAAMTLLAGSQLHNLFWPSAYSPVLTTANLLRLGFAAVVVVGGVLELRRIAAERAALLAAEREYSARLEELAALRADFTAMVAHELGSPLAAIRAFAEMLATGALDPEEQRQALAAIRTEVDLLNSLIAEVQAAAHLERADFAVNRQPVPIDALLAEAAAFARTLPGDHPVKTVVEARGQVWADPERIGQVLRNLLNNAATYSHPKTPIELRALCEGSRVRIEVVDQGYGIPPEELERIFEKYHRGRHSRERGAGGLGLGLYLSRRIVQAHGSDLTVRSQVGAGSAFSFELEAVE